MASIVAPPMRPPSINRSSVADNQGQEHEIRIETEKEDVKKVESNTVVVDQSSVTITIGDGKKSPSKNSEPSLVSYQKLEPKSTQG